MDTYYKSSDSAYDYDHPHKVAPADKKDVVFLILTFVSIFLVVDFGLAGGMNLGFTVAYAALFTTTTAYLFAKDSLRLIPTLCGLLSLALCPVFALHHDILGNTAAFFSICLLFSVYIGGCCGVLFRGTKGFRLIYDCLRILLYYPISYIASPFEGAKAARGDSEKRGKAINVILGLLICLPVLCVVIPLLVSSDAAFEGMVEILFKKIGVTLLYLFFALLLTPFLYSLLYALRHRIIETPSAPGSTRFIDNAVICGFLGLLSSVYLIYLCSQLAYFFSAFRSVLPEGYTAADYARRGFFELCAISVINLFLLFCACTLVKKSDPAADIPTPVKGFGIFLCLFNLVLVGTAISKMALYIDRFGLTRLRILTTVFMALMGVLFLCVTLRLIFRRFPYMALSVIVCTLIMGGVLYADVDTVTANYNVDAYLSGKLTDVDLYTLKELGATAVPALDRLYRTADDPTMRESALSTLSDLQEKLTPAEDFRSYNYTTDRAIRILSGISFPEDSSEVNGYAAG